LWGRRQRSPTSTSGKAIPSSLRVD
jgi:hypothetical protein